MLVQFDDSVHVAGGNAAVANSTGASIAAGSAHARSRTLTIPLRPDLPDGAYSVRWSIVSDDGHHEVGVLAFAVGTDSVAPHSILSASAPLGPVGIVLRSIWYLGLLVAAGAAALALLTRGAAPARRRRPLAHLLFFSLLLAFVGAGGLAHGGASGTRFANALDAALFVALIGATAAALAPRSEPLLRLAQGCALALLLAPVLAGHALDRDQPTLLAPLLDLAHLSAAAVWLGGLAWLLVVVPRATDDGAERRGAVERFSTVALIAVSVLGATGIGRAVTELGSFHQLWTTSYGRALLVKTALFVPLLGVGWLNRGWLNRGESSGGQSSRSASPGSFGRLRRTMRGEVVAIAGIVVAVAFLTQLRPGREAPAGTTAAPVAPAPPTLPPRDAVVGAQELGRLAVAVAREPGRATVTVVGPDATGVNGLTVRIDDRVATSCGSGCYRARSSASALHVTVGGGSLTFDLPSQAPAATALLARVGRTYRARRTLTISERLASDERPPRRAEDADLPRPVDPGVVLGDARATASPADPPLDDGGSALPGRPLLAIRRAARDLGAGLAVALRFVTEKLQEARRILEGGERGPCRARATPHRPATPERRDRTGRTQHAAQHEGADPAAPPVAVHATIIRCG